MDTNKNPTSEAGHAMLDFRCPYIDNWIWHVGFPMSVHRHGDMPYPDADVGNSGVHRII
jgi:hypothetical protein